MSKGILIIPVEVVSSGGGCGSLIFFGILLYIFITSVLPDGNNNSSNFHSGSNPGSTSSDVKGNQPQVTPTQVVWNNIYFEQYCIDMNQGEAEKVDSRGREWECHEFMIWNIDQSNITEACRLEFSQEAYAWENDVYFWQCVSGEEPTSGWNGHFPWPDSFIDLGQPDYVDYCLSKGWVGTDVVLAPFVGFSTMRCTGMNYYDISPQEVCDLQYGSGYTAEYTNWSMNNRWICSE